MRPAVRNSQCRPAAILSNVSLSAEKRRSPSLLASSSKTELAAFLLQLLNPADHIGRIVHFLLADFDDHIARTDSFLRRRARLLHIGDQNTLDLLVDLELGAHVLGQVRKLEPKRGLDF